MSLNHAIEKLVTQIESCLESDKASVFIFDAESETLWTKLKSK